MPPIRVLFLCTGNSARSILAEAVLRQTGGAAFEVHSAGTHPKGLNPFTEHVLSEAQIDTDSFRSKSVLEYEGQDFDYVISVCDQAAEECPIFPGAPERIHWSFPDPAAVEGSDLKKVEAFRETLLGLRQRIHVFIAVAQGT